MTDRHPGPWVDESGMRAPVRKMRPRRKGKQAASEADEGRTTVPAGSAAHAPAGTPADPGGRRTARVRNRLIIAVAVVAAAIAGSAAPALMTASGQVSDSQELVDLAARTQQTVTLSHSLADERDEVTAFIAAGRPKGQGLSESRSARVDRQLDELRTDAPAPCDTTSPASRPSAGPRSPARAAPSRRTRRTPARSTSCTAPPSSSPRAPRPARAPERTPSPTSTGPSSRPPPRAGSCSPRSPYPAPTRRLRSSTRSPDSRRRSSPRTPPTASSATP